MRADCALRSRDAQLISRADRRPSHAAQAPLKAAIGRRARGRHIRPPPHDLGWPSSGPAAQSSTALLDRSSTTSCAARRSASAPRRKQHRRASNDAPGRREGCSGSTPPDRNDSVEGPAPRESERELNRRDKTMAEEDRSPTVRAAIGEESSRASAKSIARGSACSADRRHRRDLLQRRGCEGCLREALRARGYLDAGRSLQGRLHGAKILPRSR